MRTLLVARKQLLGVELSIRGIPHNFGLKVGRVTDMTGNSTPPT